MKLIHIGDLHLRPDARNAMRRKALEEIVDAGLRMDDLGAWLWPGDLNDGKMSIPDRNWLAKILSEMASHAPVYGCYGNHDVPGDLDIFEQLQAKYDIHFWDKPGVHVMGLAGGNSAAHSASLFVLPYPDKGRIVAGGFDVSEAHDPLASIIRQASREMLDFLRLHPTGVPLMIGHINVAGSIASTGQPQIGREVELSRDLLDLLPPKTYIGLNHIHKAQAVGRAWYAGSVCRLNWGETEPKSYVVIEPGVGVEMVLLDVPPMVHIEGTWVGDEGHPGCPLENCFQWRSKQGAGETQWGAQSGMELRVRYRYPVTQDIDHALLRKHWVDIAQPSRLVMEPIAIPDDGLRSEAVANAETVRDKVVAWAKESGAWSQTGDDLPAEDELATGVMDKLEFLLQPAGTVIEPEVGGAE